MSTQAQRLVMVSQPTFHITCTDTGETVNNAGMRFLWQTWIDGKPVKAFNCPSAMGFQEGTRTYIQYLTTREQLKNHPVVRDWVDKQNVMAGHIPIVFCCPCLPIETYQELTAQLYERGLLAPSYVEPKLLITPGGGANVQITMIPANYSTFVLASIFLRTDTLVLAAHQGCMHVKTTKRRHEGKTLRLVETNARKLFPYMERFRRPLAKLIVVYMQEVNGEMGYITTEYLQK